MAAHATGILGYHAREESLPQVATPWTTIRLLSTIPPGGIGTKPKDKLLNNITCCIENR
jgi:hypothetical protein